MGSSESDLRPAVEVTAERDHSQSVDLDVGQGFELADGVVVLISDIRLNPDTEPVSIGNQATL